MKNRIAYIDILRALAIILVIVGHITYPGFNHELKKWVYAFHVPLLFFVSGMSMSFTNYKAINLKTLFKKRLLHIYCPYLIWGILLALPSITLLSIPKILYGTHQSIASASNSSLWFLPVLFLSTLFLDLVLYTSIRKKRLFLLKILPLLLLIIVLLIPSQSSIQALLHGHNLPFGLDIVPMASLFMIMGYLFQNHRNNRVRTRSSLLLTSLAFITSILLNIIFCLNNEVNYALMAENRYGNIFYFMIASFSGIFMSFIISLLIEKNTKKISKLLQLIGANTLIIFILHKYPLALLNELFFLIPMPISNWILVPICVIIVTPICLILSLFFKKYTPILAGSQKIKS